MLCPYIRFNLAAKTFVDKGGIVDKDGGVPADPVQASMLVVYHELMQASNAFKKSFPNPGSFTDIYEALKNSCCALILARKEFYDTSSAVPLSELTPMLKAVPTLNTDDLKSYVAAVKPNEGHILKHSGDADNIMVSIQRDRDAFGCGISDLSTKFAVSCLHTMANGQ